MPFNIRQGSRCAASLAALLCMMVALGAAPIAAAQTEGTEGAQRATPAAKRKIALAQFDVVNTLHVDDINNIYDGLPLALAGRLEASGEFLSAYSGRSIPAEAGEAQREAITRIAAESGAQFLISGVVVNAGTKREKGYLGTSIGGDAKRHIEVELAVYDGLTGNRLLLRRLGEQAQGEVRVGNDKPFGSSIFFETEFGQATNRLLDLAVKDIRAALEKVPFSANVIRVEGRKAYLDAGSDALLKSGDQLVVYVRDAAPVVGLKGSVLGVTDSAADTLTLTQVQPQFSIGELTEEAAKFGIKAGNIARIDPVEQRALLARQIAAQQVARAEQEARAEAERVKAEKAAQAAKAEQAEAARLKAEKEAKAQAAAEAKAAKLKAAQETKVRRLSAAQEARAREKAQAARNAARAKREAAKAEAERIKAEKKAEAEAKKQADAEAKLKATQEAKAEAERVKAEKAAQTKAEKEAKAKEQPAAETKAGAAPNSAKEKTTPKSPAKMEVRAVAIEDLQREAAEAAKAEAASGVPPEQKKPGVPLKLKQIKP